MCNVCVARDALATSSCGKDDCVAFETGHRHVWSKGPILKQARRKSVRKKDGGLIFLPVARRPKQPTVYIRARGRDAEGRAQFQLRREHELWPKTWQTTDDLANAVAMYGLDSHWGQNVPKPVQQWLTYETSEMPSLDVLHELQARRNERRSARRTTVPRRRVRRGVRRAAPQRVFATHP